MGMASWQRRARLVIGLSAVAFAVAIYFAIGERRQPAALAPVDRLDPGASVEIRGGDAVRLSGTARDFAIRYASSLAYDDGRSRFLDAHVIVEDRGRRDFEITARELLVGPDQATLELEGDVTLTSSDGLTVHGDRASYRDAEGLLTVPGDVRFTRPRIEGRGVGLTWDRGRDTLTILDQADVRFAGGADAPAMQVRAGTVTHVNVDRFLRFERTVTLERDGDNLAGERAMVWLHEDGGPATIELAGDARVDGGNFAGFRAMQADTVTLHYTADDGSLRQAVLAGDGRIELRGALGGSQQLAAQWIDAMLAPDGTVTALLSRDQVVVSLPGGREVPAREIRSGRLTGRGAAGQGLSAMSFRSAVEFREAAAAARLARTARAEELDLELNAEDGVDTARFAGGVRFESGSLRAAARTADYDVAAGTLALSGRQGGSLPRVTDETATIDAETITTAIDGGDITATGSVRSVLQPAGAADEGRRTALVDAGQSVNVAAESLVYDGTARLGVYEGQARLWQGDTSIQAGRLVLDDRSGDLTATGGVRSTLPLGPAADGGGAPVTIGRADTFTYAEDARRVTYDGSAQINGPEGGVRADRIVLHLSSADRGVERLDARGTVSVRLDDRAATGASLDYQAADARYEMRGTPVQFVEPCRETTGRILTFFRGIDRILVDGNEETRTQTKGGGKCPDPRFE
jgi:lipopolysaccharide export system protein LptA